MGGGQGPHLHEQDLEGRAIRGHRGTGVGGERIATRREGDWAGFTHTIGSQGFP